jgi:choline dehydrogenase
VDAADYVIVGAGTAGCVLAERLSASGRDQVMLLEAGGTDQRLWIRVPIGYGRTFNDPAVNWMYETEPDPGLGGVRSFWPRGKVLGGSGSINAMVYVRGQPSDFDDWAALGNPGWAWNDVLPHFQAIESGPTQPGLCITDVSAATHPLCRAFLRAGESLGFAHTPDFNGAQSEGVGCYRITTRQGLRDSTATAFLRPALQRRNLQLRLHSRVHGIVFDGLRATAVRYRREGHALLAGARKAVILCAGSIGSPLLLQLSGVGPGDLLQRLGIACRVDRRAVGRNLQDHLAVSYFYRSRIPTLNNELAPAWGKLRAALKYLLQRRGPLSMSVNQAGGFVRSDASQRVPNLQLYCNPASYTLTRERTRKLMNPDPFAAFLLSFNSCRPSSRGSLRLRSPDPEDPPLIEPNYLSTQQDLQDAILGMHLLRALAAAPPLAALIESEMLPGVATQGDAALLQDFRARAGSVFHPVGTCAMGVDPAHSVVDARLRVHGVERLRVIDAAAFPTLTSGNTNAPTAMLADKGAAMLLQDER